MYSSRNLVHGVSLGGILVAVTVLLLAAPVLLPGIGLFLPPFSTLPIAIATAYSPGTGLLTLLAAGAIGSALNPYEAILLLLATGPLGGAIGVFVRRNSLLWPVLAGGGILFIGILALNYLLGIPAFGGALKLFPRLAAYQAFLLFAVIYAFAWARLIRRVVRQLDGIQGHWFYRRRA